MVPLRLQLLGFEVEKMKIRLISDTATKWHKRQKTTKCQQQQRQTGLLINFKARTAMTLKISAINAGLRESPKNWQPCFRSWSHYISSKSLKVNKVLNKIQAFNNKITKFNTDEWNRLSSFSSGWCLLTYWNSFVEELTLTNKMELGGNKSLHCFQP